MELPNHPREWWILWAWTIGSAMLIVLTLFVILPATLSPEEGSYKFFDGNVTFTLTEKNYDRYYNFTRIGPDNGINCNMFFFTNVSEFKEMELGSNYQCRYTNGLLHCINNTISDCKRTSPEIFNTSRNNEQIMSGKDESEYDNGKIEKQKMSEDDADRAKGRGKIHGDPVVEI